MIIEHSYIILNFGLNDLNVTYDIAQTKNPLIDTIYYEIKTTDYESNTTVYSSIITFSTDIENMNAKINDVNGIDYNPTNHDFDGTKLGKIMMELATEENLQTFKTIEDDNIQKIYSIVASANN